MRRIHCNRTLNLRAIKAIGYDMDYTLIHYDVAAWERHAYDHVKRRFADAGWPVAQLSFDPSLMIRGLIIDTERGNILKVNRFGFVKHAFHGTRPLGFEQTKELYSREVVDLAERRWQFLNTLFSLSEGCLYAQLVELLDQQRLTGVMGYEDLYRRVRHTMDLTHLEGSLKQEIIADPDRFVELDPNTALALLDQRHAGKKLALITNSEWHYTQAMMAYAFDRYLDGASWRSLFDLVIIDARKPTFFSAHNAAFEVVNDEGLLKPTHELRDGGIYLGGHADLVEKCLQLQGEQILYVGDHIFSDVNVSKSLQRWRTALVLRELEGEVAALTQFAPQQLQLQHLMVEKEKLEAQYCTVKLDEQRTRIGYGIRSGRPLPEITEELTRLRNQVQNMDESIAPLAKAASELANPHWGLLMRAGNDKSHLARQVERHADIYMARVSDFSTESPFVYLRSVRGSLPHDPGDGF